MAKGAYGPSESVYRKIKKIYGTRNGVYHKIKKGYAAADGVYRLFFSGEKKLKYYGQVTSLLIGYAIYSLAATHTDSHAIFVRMHQQTGGIPFINGITAYDQKLTASTVSAGDLVLAVSQGIGTTEYGYLATTMAYSYGSTDSYRYNGVSRFNKSLTWASMGNLSTYPDNDSISVSATSLGEYAVISSYKPYNTTVTTVDAYNNAGTKHACANLSSKRNPMAAATANGKYALFGAGTGSAYEVDAYDLSLTRISAPAMTEGYAQSALSVGDYALFGSVGGGTTTVIGYNSSLTKITAPSLSVSTAMEGVTLGEYGLFSVSGNGGAINSYDSSLTRQVLQGVTAQLWPGETVGDFALFNQTGQYGSNNMYAYYLAEE